MVSDFCHKTFIFKICWGRGEYTNFSSTCYHIAYLSICISHTSSILLLTIGLSGSPQAALSSAPRLTTASSSSCSPSISSLAAYKEEKKSTMLILNLIAYVQLAFKIEHSRIPLFSFKSLGLATGCLKK